MADFKEQVSIWSSFDNMTKEAEEKFYAQEFETALNLWREYARITGTVSWQKSFDDLNVLIDAYLVKDFSDPYIYFEEWLRLRGKIKENDISFYAFNLMEKLLAKNFLSAKQTVSFDIATGIFCFIEDNIEKAIENLKSVLNKEPENFLARIFLSRCYFSKADEEKGTAYLSQAMFLGGNDLLIEDVGSTQINNLYGRLKSLHGKGEVGVWLVPFEAWFRNWLIWIEDMPFFQVMQKKERNERILQVKYYTSEKYRHFIRCLFIAEYVRNYLPKEKGMIWEQEAYMEKLDAGLFQRYRKKRKPVA
jgi:hypothetical protein